MTETELAAGRAWLAMHRMTAPMPAGVALDMVQDVCDDRDEAVGSLLRAAVAWLDPLRPEQPSGHMSTALHTAVLARGDLLGEYWYHAMDSRDTLAASSWGVVGAYETRDPNYTADDHERACAWLRWCAYFTRALDLCRAICAAAYPVEEPQS